MGRLLAWAIALLGLCLVGVSHAAEVARLGDAARVTALFSYPNNCSTICYKPQSLEETVRHWIEQGLRRDGFTSATVTVSLNGGVYHAEFAGPGDKEYAAAVEGLLKAGDSALTAARQLRADKKWKYNWRFFLPLGVAMVNNPTVQLLHFPPDYVLEDVQDYLKTRTTERWGELLEKNGVASTQTPRYQAIVDIAPVAAPSDAGEALAGIYSYFDEYIVQLLELWIRRSTVSEPRPVVAYGAPVRDWIKSKFGKSLAVLDVAALTLPSGGIPFPVIGANHPSYIFYAANRFVCGPDKDLKNFAAGMKVMEQDLVVACWQARMGTRPAADPTAVKQACVNHWRPKARERCELLQAQVYGKTPGEATAICNATPLSSDRGLSERELADMERTAPLRLLWR